MIISFPRFILAGVIAALLPVAAQAAPPPNDNFAQRAALSGQAVSSTPVAIAEATREGLEPDYTGDNTVWYTWTPSVDGIATFTTAGTSFGAKLVIFNGDSYANLVPITSSRDLPASVSFPVKAGFAYQISLGYAYGDGDTAILNIKNSPTTITSPQVIAVSATGNDNFAQAKSLGSFPVVSGFTYPSKATREGQEPSYTGDATVWWVWQAPSDCQVTVTSDGTNYGVLLSVFNGDSLSSIEPVVIVRDLPARATFPAKKGFVYRISQGHAYGDTPVTAVLNIITSASTITAPVVIGSQANANDGFARPQSLGSNPVVSGFGFNDNASTETLEPSNYGTRTLWWTWTAPEDGTLDVTTAGTTFNNRLTVLAGDSLSAPDDGGTDRGFPPQAATASGPVVKGKLYRLVIGSDSGGTGTAVLNLGFTPGLSKVGIAANAKVVRQAETSVAKFTLTRTGDLSKKVKVRYVVKGSSSVFTGSTTGTKQIKVGKATAVLNVNFSGTGFNRAKITVTLLEGNGYLVGSPAKANIKVIGR